jgi:hypothetical protein
MSFWNKIQEDLKKNIHEGLEIFKEGSSVVTEKIEKLTEGGKNKYKAFNLNMKVQEEFAKLGGEIYDLITKKSKNPLASKKVKSIITRINKFEAQINKLESKGKKKTRKTTAKKTARKRTKKTTGKTAAKGRVKTKSARKAPVSTKES